VLLLSGTQSDAVGEVFQATLTIGEIDSMGTIRNDINCPFITPVEHSRRK
jgi:hypothetical protein